MHCRRARPDWRSPFCTVAYALDNRESCACRRPTHPAGRCRPSSTIAGADVRTLAVRAPTRVDFGGGWTDVPPYSTEQGGCVCAMAIGRYVTVELSESAAADPSRTGAESRIAAAALAKSGVSGVSLSLQSDVPVGAGLGGSSAAGVAAV